MSSIKENKIDWQILKRLVALAKPYSKMFWITASITVLLALMGPVRPIIIQMEVDQFIAQGDGKRLLNWTLILIGLLVVEAVMQFAATYYANWLAQSIIRDLRGQLYSKINSFKLKFFDKTPIGTLVTRVISDIESIAEVFSEGILNILGDILKLIVVIAVMFYLNWQLTLLSLIPIPILLVATQIFKNAIKTAYQEVSTAVANLNRFVQEHITGISIIQIFNRQERELEKFKKINGEHKAAHIKSVWAYSIFFPVVEILSSLSLAFLVWYGVSGLVETKVTFGEVVSFTLFIYMLYRPIRQLADRFNVIQMGIVRAERVNKLLDMDAQIEDNGSVENIEITGAVSFKNVWFAYQEEDWVLRDLSFHVKPGEKIAFVGATGAGKSSIINLLNRFYEYQQGEIKLDDHNLRDLKLTEVRKHIAVVLQDVFLFSDTILHNITLGNPSITREQVIEAAKFVEVDQFIMKLPNGYDYHVGERGGVLSAGQRQLLAFLRAYVYNPSILVLDEATSSIDTESEMLIQKAIDKITANRTSFIIAHRLSTVIKADRIYVLEKGKIIEFGTHAELLEKKGHYRQLFDMQFVDAEV
ncbi:MAG: ABC transporter ATP-binding protein [Luteibaculaceae bacterium]